jgi:hypothetical protein
LAKEPMENDRLDSLLARLPGDAPPLELGLRICRAIRERQRRHRRRAEQAIVSLSSFLALAGAWLAIPLLSEAVRRLALPPSGFPVLRNGYEIAQTNLIVGLSPGLESLLSLQERFASGFEATGWAGVLILASGALLALHQILLGKKIQ